MEYRERKSTGNAPLRRKFESAIDALWDVMQRFDPQLYIRLYLGRPGRPRFQLAPLGERGYIEAAGAASPPLRLAAKPGLGERTAGSADFGGGFQPQQFFHGRCREFALRYQNFRIWRTPRCSP